MASSYTFGFNSETGAPGLGSFSIDFEPGSTWLLGAYASRDAVDAGGPTQNWAFDTLVVTPSRMGNPSRSELLEAALWSGRIQRFSFDTKPSTPWTISGPSILAWLGDGDTPGKGPGINSYGTTSASNLGTYLTSFLTTGGHTNGLSWSSSGLSASAMGIKIEKHDSARDRINKMLRASGSGAEYRCTPAGELLFAPVGGSYAYRQTPTVILTTRNLDGRDGDLEAFKIEGTAELDWGDVTDSVLAYNDNAAVPWSASSVFVGAGRNFKDFGGVNSAAMSALMAVNDDQGYLGFSAMLYQMFRRKDRLSLQVSAGMLAKYVNCGDHVWIDAPELLLNDPEESINFGGMETHPIKARTSEMVCPLRKENGVYIIHNATASGGANAVEDLSEKVIPQSDKATASLSFDPLPPNRRQIQGTRWRSGFESIPFAQP